MYQNFLLKQNLKQKNNFFYIKRKKKCFFERTVKTNVLELIIFLKWKSQSKKQIQTKKSTKKKIDFFKKFLALYLFVF